MNEAGKRLSDAARELSTNDRLELVEQLLDSLDTPDLTIDRLWTAEAEERLAAYRRGEIDAVPLAGIIAKYTPS